MSGSSVGMRSCAIVGGFGNLEEHVATLSVLLPHLALWPATGLLHLGRTGRPVVSDITVEDLRTSETRATRCHDPVKASKKRKSDQVPKYTVIGESSEGKVTTCFTPDRNELCLIKVGGHQRCQIRSTVFTAKEGGTQREAAVELVRQLA